MPAAMHRHAIDPIGAVENTAVLRLFLPFRIVGKRRYHLDVVAGLAQELADRHVVWSDAGDLRRIIDSPNNDAHGV